MSIKQIMCGARRSAERGADQLAMFFCFWALKESYLKATGIGLGIDLVRLHFDIRKGTGRQARAREEAAP
jgi:phosphopantetheinyl transferase